VCVHLWVCASLWLCKCERGWVLVCIYVSMRVWACMSTGACEVCVGRDASVSVHVCALTFLWQLRILASVAHPQLFSEGSPHALPARLGIERECLPEAGLIELRGHSWWGGLTPPLILPCLPQHILFNWHIEENVPCAQFSSPTQAVRLNTTMVQRN
jgi:hypothetical protein